MNSQDDSAISRFFEGKSIFITGGTGFLGKILVQKLLSLTPPVQRIYLLVRPKKNLSGKERLTKLLNEPIFESLSNDKDSLRSRLQVIDGELTLPQLGISTEDQNELTANVAIVFHSAATVKFDEDLTQSVAMNVMGTQEVVDLAKRMSKLQALVHVSTAYCNCDREDAIDEIFYDPSASAEGLINLCNYLKPELINDAVMTKRIIGKKPNTYTFTKAIAESVLEAECGNLPLAIIRPSQVVAAWQEPIPGWIDNYNGPTGMMAGFGTGTLRSLLINRSAKADLIPVDMCINLLCAAAWSIGQETGKIPNHIPIYNFTSGELNPITWSEIEQICYNSILQYPMEPLYWYPCGSFKTVAWQHKICHLVLHLMPSYLADAVLWILGCRRFFVKMTRKIEKAIVATQYFTLREWNWTTKQVSALIESLNETDKKMFDFDVRHVMWKPFLDSYVQGTRTYVLKCDPATLGASRKKLTRFRFAHNVVKIFLFLLFCYVFVCCGGFLISWIL